MVVTVVTVVTWECVSVAMCEGWNGMGGGKSMKKVVGVWWESGGESGSMRGR